MPALPVNANRKIDLVAIRRTVEALGESGQLLPERLSIGSREERDLTDSEKVVRSLWAKVLSLSESEISLKDSFISLGGTSLKAIQVMSQLQVLHQLSLRVEDILLGETLFQVAAAVQPQPVEGKPDNNTISAALFEVAPSIESVGISISSIEDAFPVTPFQEAAIANIIIGGTSYIYSRSYSFEGYSPDDVRAAFKTLMKSDGWLRTTYIPYRTSFLQVVKKTADLPWETSDMDVTEYLQKQTSKGMYPGELW